MVGAGRRLAEVGRDAKNQRLRCRVYEKRRWPGIFGYLGCYSPLGGGTVAIYRMLDGLAFGPEDVKAMTTAYEAVLIVLGLTDRADPMTEVVARKIIAYCKADGCDPDALRGQ